MRWIGAMVLAAGTASTASTASAQIVWVGASWGTSWEWQAPTSPNKDFLHSSDGAPSAFVAFPIDHSTLFRLQAANLPHVTVINGVGWPGHYRAYTAGIDYLIDDPFGRSLFSAGFGSYTFNLKAQRPPAGYQDTKFGWYVGVGEWFNLMRNLWATAEVRMNRTQHAERPQLFTANIGLAYNW